MLNRSKKRQVPGYICYRFEDETDDNSEVIRRKMVNAIRLNLIFLIDTKEVTYWKSVYFIPRDYQVNLSFLNKLDMAFPVEATFKDRSFEGFKKYQIDNIKIWSEFLFQQLQDKIELKAAEIEKLKMAAERKRAQELNEKFAQELAEKEAAKAAKALEKEQAKFEAKMKKMQEKFDKKHA